jgi:adenosylhomocysteinase
MSKVKDESLAAQGKAIIDYAERQMPVLSIIKKRFSKEQPLAGKRIAACLHVTKETAVLMRVLRAGGAEVALCGSNPLSTQDDVAAALAAEGIETFAWRGQGEKEYYACISDALALKPQITMDDGADLITTLHTKRKELLPNVLGSTEETTTGVIRLRAMQRDGTLRIPVIAVNDARSKNMFDNYYGTGESALHGILRATNALLPGKNFVIIGYGHCGRGVAAFAKGFGCHTIVCDIDPVAALQAHYDGHRVMTSEQAAAEGDIFLTVTGCKDALTAKHFKRMKDGAVLANAGHFNVEINIAELEGLAKRKRTVRPNVQEYELDAKRIYLLGEGRLVNLAAAEGHPSEVMDLSFSLQALAAEYIAKHKLEARVHQIPADVDENVARLKLQALGVSIDELTPAQKKYLAGWSEGT